MTHVIRKVKGEKVVVMRTMNPYKPPLPFGMYKGVFEAKFNCERDTEWLLLASPLRDKEREAAYELWLETYQHPVL
jgi:hypothetical protein